MILLYYHPYRTAKIELLFSNETFVMQLTPVTMAHTLLPCILRIHNTSLLCGLWHTTAVIILVVYWSTIYGPAMCSS